MALEIITIGGIDILSQAFNAVATITSNTTFFNLMYVAEVIGVLACVIKYIKTRDIKVMGLWLLFFVVVNGLLLTPKQHDVETTDPNAEFKVGTAGGWSIPEAKSLLQGIEKHIPRADLEVVADLLSDLNQARLEMDFNVGRYTPEQYQEYKANRHYVPLTGDPKSQYREEVYKWNALFQGRVGDSLNSIRTAQQAAAAASAINPYEGLGQAVSGLSNIGVALGRMKTAEFGAMNSWATPAFANGLW